MGYTLIPLLAAIGLGFHFVVITQAPTRPKAIVAAVVALSLVLRFQFPRWTLLAILLQVAASIYVILYLKLHPYGF